MPKSGNIKRLTWLAPTVDDPATTYPQRKLPFHHPSQMPRSPASPPPGGKAPPEPPDAGASAGAFVRGALAVALRPSFIIPLVAVALLPISSALRIVWFFATLPFVVAARLSVSLPLVNGSRHARGSVSISAIYPQCQTSNLRYVKQVQC